LREFCSQAAGESGPRIILETRRYEARAGFAQIAKNRWYVFGCVFARRQNELRKSRLANRFLGAGLSGLIQVELLTNACQHIILHEVLESAAAG